MKHHGSLLLLALATGLAPGCKGASSDEADSAGTEGDGTGTSGDDDGGDDDGLQSACDEQLPARRIRRLSHAEYEATVADLVAGQQVDASLLASDVVVDGYLNNADVLVVSGLLADQYRANAETIADAMVGDLSAFLPCDPGATGEADCAQTFVESFGRRAFRRPLEAAEVEAFMGLYDEVAAEEGFDEAMRWVVSALLQSPKFLYRTELGVQLDDGTWELTSHELAEQLSYLVTGTMPDDELAAAADDDLLRDPAELQAQAERLVAMSSARDPLLRFVDQWLGTRQIDFVTRDAETYPDLTPEIRAAMREEVAGVVTTVYEQGGTLRDLLLADFTVASPQLAAYYGLEHPGGGTATIAATERGGLLTLGAVLTTHALPRTSSPVHRGVMVRERLLCNDLPPPPPGVVNGAPEVDPAASTRERYEQHSSDPACAGCHQLIDPIGFAFEHYDGVGRWRDDDLGHTIDASGYIAGGESEVDFEGPRELADALAGDPAVQACYARQWASFALGGTTNDDGFACLVDALGQGFVDTDARLDALVPLLVSAPGFRLRRDGDPIPPSDDPPPDPTGDDPTTGDPDDSGGGDDAPVNDPSIDIMVMQTGTWPTGECNQITVTNVSDANVTWEVLLPIEGTITTAWSCTWSEVGGNWSFVGVDFNGTLAPGVSGDFGYCVEFGG